MTEKIQEFIDNNVQCDHADIRVESFADGVLSVALMGACAGCPGAAITVRELLEGELAQAFPEIRRVEVAQNISEETLDFARKLLTRPARNEPLA